MSSNKHLAAVLHAKGTSLKIEERTTPRPGPNEMLIEVKSIALNPIDVLMRDFGFTISEYPAVPGSDVAGTVLEVGSDVSSSLARIGERVLAFAPAFFKQGHSNYGGLQTRVLVPVQNVCPIPDHLNYHEAATMPMCVLTAWRGLYTLGIARETKLSASERQGILVWGGASSVGCGAIQIAKSMGFVVYSTAREENHSYIKELGASRTFDYKSGDAVDKIIKAAQEDGLAIQYGFDAVGQLAPCLDILKQTGSGLAQLATAKRFGVKNPIIPEVEVRWIEPARSVEEQKEFHGFVFNKWLRRTLEKKQWIPSPKLKVMSGGLKSINAALDELKGGLSCTKLVIEV